MPAIFANLADERKLIEYMTSTGPRVFEAPISAPDVRPLIMKSMLDSGLQITWSSERDTHRYVWQNTGEPSKRSRTLLNVSSLPFLEKDLDDSSSDGVGRRYTITALDDDLIRDEPHMDRIMKGFLHSGRGMEWIIYQPGDTWEYLFLTRMPSCHTNRLMTEWGITSEAKLREPSRWVRRTLESGILPQ